MNIVDEKRKVSFVVSLMSNENKVFVTENSLPFYEMFCGTQFNNLKIIYPQTIFSDKIFYQMINYISYK